MSNLELSIQVTLVGLIVVFAVLLLLVLVVWLLKLVAGSKDKKGGDGDGTAAGGGGVGGAGTATPPSAQAITPLAADKQGEIIAVITAAITAMTGSSAFAIKSIVRQQAGRNAWSLAGAVQNTQPF